MSDFTSTTTVNLAALKGVDPSPAAAVSRPPSPQDHNERSVRVCADTADGNSALLRTALVGDAQNFGLGVRTLTDSFTKVAGAADVGGGVIPPALLGGLGRSVIMPTERIAGVDVQNPSVTTHAGPGCKGRKP